MNKALMSQTEMEDMLLCIYSSIVFKSLHSYYHRDCVLLFFHSCIFFTCHNFSLLLFFHAI